MQPDNRTPEQYRADVDTYLKLYEEHLRRLVLYRYSQMSSGIVHFRIVNDTRRTIEGVSITVRFRGNLKVLNPARIRIPNAPTPPREYGPIPQAKMYGLENLLRSPGELPSPYLPDSGSPYIENGEVCSASFSAVTIAAEDSLELDPLMLLINPGNGQVVEGSWEATAKVEEGRIRRDFEIRLSDDLLPIHDCLREADAV